MTSPLVDCRNGIYWIPFSYTGTNGRQILPFKGIDTGRSITEASIRMGQVYDLAMQQAQKQNLSFASVYIIAHSLGGTVGSFWGSSHKDKVRVITLDSPINGFWNLSQGDGRDALGAYCVGSGGEPLSPGICELSVHFVGAINSPIAQQMSSGTFTADDGTSVSLFDQTRGANAYNFAYASDYFVPSWYALSPRDSTPGMLLTNPTDQCPDPLSLSNLVYHGCVITFAASTVSDIVTGDKWDTYRSQAQEYSSTFRLSVCTNLTDTLHVTAFQRGDKNAKLFEGTLSGSSTSGTVSCTVLPPMPWIDVLVTVDTLTSPIKLGVLPGNDHQMFVNINVTGQATVTEGATDIGT